MDTPASPFTVFCQKAFDFLDAAGVRHLVIGGLAVGVIGEARTTADVDVIGWRSGAVARPGCDGGRLPARSRPIA
jgi:hypothetical protein